MSAFAAAILDELMGRDRNSNPDEKSKELNWSDQEVCKYYLCGFCPAILFQNTRADIGVCNKIHEDELAMSYQGSTRYLKMGYEDDFLLYLEQITNDIDRKINRNVTRIAHNTANAKEQAQKSQTDRINNLSEKINSLLEKVEELGSIGEVDEAQNTMKIVDTLKSERTQQQLAMESMQPIVVAKEMEVCLVCGAFLVVGDAQQRIDEHLAGKLHLGYAKVRSYVETLRDKLKAAELEREKKRQERRALNGIVDKQPLTEISDRAVSQNRRGSKRRSRSRSKHKRSVGEKKSRSESRLDRRRSQSILSNNKDSRHRKDVEKRRNGHDKDSDCNADKNKHHDVDKDVNKEREREKKNREKDADREHKNKGKMDKNEKDRKDDKHRDRNSGRERTHETRRDRSRDRERNRDGGDRDRDKDKNGRRTKERKYEDSERRKKSRSRSRKHSGKR